MRISLQNEKSIQTSIFQVIRGHFSDAQGQNIDIATFNVTKIAIATLKATKSSQRRSRSQDRRSDVPRWQKRQSNVQGHHSYIRSITRLRVFIHIFNYYVSIYSFIYSFILTIFVSSNYFFYFILYMTDYQYEYFQR